MMRKRYLATWTALLAVAALPVWAAEGRIPLWEPTVITQPGHYVVTRDISASSGPVFDIEADGVSLDLNGHTVTLTSMTEPVILIGAQSGIEPIPFRLRNGRIHGGLHGIHALNQVPRHLVLQELMISGAAEQAVLAENVGQLDAAGIIVIESKVGMELHGTAGVSVARIVGANIVAEGGVHCHGLTCTVEHSSFAHPAGGIDPTPFLRFEGALAGTVRDVDATGQVSGIEPVPFLELLSSKGIIIINNKVGGTGNGGPCILVDAASHRATIRNNVLSGCGSHGIEVLSSGNWIAGNLVTDSGGDGIHVAGANNLVDDNKISSSVGAGLWFETSDHIYRNNVLRGNTGGAQDGPGETGVTDGGGNLQ